jgi:c(7)-type cytochrome triheme protein
VRRPTLRVTTCLVLGLALTLAGAAAALNRMPKLPAALTLPQGGDSPGKVTFNHESHVDTARPDCTSCHPSLFSILKKGPGPDRKALTHDGMTKGQGCGSCHGKAAFGFDDCAMCHRTA